MFINKPTQLGENTNQLKCENDENDATNVPVAMHYSHLPWHHAAIPPKEVEFGVAAAGREDAKASDAGIGPPETAPRARRHVRNAANKPLLQIAGTCTLRGTETSRVRTSVRRRRGTDPSNIPRRERRARVNAPRRIVSTVNASLLAMARRQSTLTGSSLIHSARNEVFSRINDTFQSTF